MGLIPHMTAKLKDEKQLELCYLFHLMFYMYEYCGAQHEIKDFVPKIYHLMHNNFMYHQSIFDFGALMEN